MRPGHLEELAQRLVAIAAAEVGTREVGGNNLGPRVVEYQRAVTDDLPPGPWPWCAAFTAWVLREWLRDPDVLDVDALNLTAENAEQWRCRDPGAFKWEGWARERGLLVLDERQPSLPGDFVTFDFSHIGIVSEDHGGSVLTIEGNTSPRGGRDSEQGDGVWRMARPRHLVRRFIRILA